MSHLSSFDYYNLRVSQEAQDKAAQQKAETDAELQALKRDMEADEYFQNHWHAMLDHLLPGDIATLTEEDKLRAYEAYLDEERERQA